MPASSPGCLAVVQGRAQVGDETLVKFERNDLQRHRPALTNDTIDHGRCERPDTCTGIKHPQRPGRRELNEIREEARHWGGREELAKLATPTRRDAFRDEPAPVFGSLL